MKNPITILKKTYSALLRTPSIDDKVAQLSKQLNIVINSLSLIQEQQEYLKQRVDRLQKANELYFDAIFGDAGETKKDIQKRFFYTMPLAEGDLRLYQLGNAKLLKTLVGLCKKYHFAYWLQSGTLLGAIRHKGFVPWDDDTDIAMFRGDIYKLRKLLKDNKDYQISLIYDYYNKSRQMRFRTRDRDNPCFIDVYIYDYGDDSSDEAWERWHVHKREITMFFDESSLPEVVAWRNHPYLEEGEKYSKEIEKLMKEKYPEPKTPPTHKSKAVIWGLDNFPVKWKRLFDWDFIFPTIKLPYESEEYEAPNKYMDYVERQYGDIYRLPEDLVSHFQHIDHNNINTDVIKRFINKE